MEYESEDGRATGVDGGRQTSVGSLRSSYIFVDSLVVSGRKARGGDCQVVVQPSCAWIWRCWTWLQADVHVTKGHRLECPVFEV
jgi:hypothetical protein